MVNAVTTNKEKELEMTEDAPLYHSEGSPCIFIIHTQVSIAIGFLLRSRFAGSKNMCFL